MQEYHILIADDDPEQLRILTGYILDSMPECRLMIATNGKAALEIASAGGLNLILLDWEMPVMTGFEALAKLKASPSTQMIPVIMATGVHYETDSLQAALESGAADFLRKPFNKIELAARIKSQLNHIDFMRKIRSQEKELMEKEKLLLKEEISENKKQLALNSLNILKLGQLIDSISNEIVSLKPYANEEGKRKIKEITSRINLQSSEHLWNEFELSFLKVHSRFYTNLAERIPDITLKEKRLCAFLKMNMSTKEIAAVTFQSGNSIDVAKHRLRNRAGIEKNEDLVNFIHSL